MATLRAEVMERLRLRSPRGLGFDMLMKCCHPKSSHVLELLLSNLKRNKNIFCRDGLWFSGPYVGAVPAVSHVPIKNLPEKIEFINRLIDNFSSIADDLREIRDDLVRLG